MSHRSISNAVKYGLRLISTSHLSSANLNKEDNGSLLATCHIIGTNVCVHVCVCVCACVCVRGKIMLANTPAAAYSHHNHSYYTKCMARELQLQSYDSLEIISHDN